MSKSENNQFRMSVLKHQDRGVGKKATSFRHGEVQIDEA